VGRWRGDKIENDYLWRRWWRVENLITHQKLDKDRARMEDSGKRFFTAKGRETKEVARAKSCGQKDKKRPQPRRMVLCRSIKVDGAVTETKQKKANAQVATILHVIK